MKTILSVFAFIATLAGCSVDPQAAAERRANLMERVFPDPADRQGLFLALPLESGGLYDTIEVIHFVDEVSRSEVERRVSAFCTRQSSTRLTGQITVRKDEGNREITLPDGSKKIGRDTWYDCVRT